MRGIAALAAVLTLPAGAQERVDWVKVDTAIRDGVSCLKSLEGNYGTCPDDLVLYALLHAELPSSDPEVQRLLKKVSESEFRRTDAAAFRAMALEDLDRIRHRREIWRCASYLVSSQAADGRWDGGAPRAVPDDFPLDEPVKVEDGIRNYKPRPARRVRLQKVREGPDAGDAWNSFFALMGLRACHESGIDFEKEVLENAVKPCREALAKEGMMAPREVAAAVAGLVLSKSMLLEKEGWKKDAEVLRALERLERDFGATGRPAGGEGEIDYSCLLPFKQAKSVDQPRWEAMGRPRCSEGFGALLEARKPDGSWGAGAADTCFALLFLDTTVRINPLPPRDAGR